MNRRACIITTLLAIICMSGCENESNDFGFSINADPSRTHAPGNIAFELVRDDGGDIRKCRGDWNFGDGVTLGGTHEATHTYQTAGVYTVSVELSCDNQKGQSTTVVEVYDTVDLTIGAIEARPLDVSTDGSLSVSLQISNEAPSALQVPTNVDLYLTPTQSPTAYLEPGAFRIYRHPVASLGAAGTESAIQKADLSIPMTSGISTGKYFVVAAINPDHAIGESTYDNNAAVSYQSITVRNQSTDGADFEPTAFTVSPETTSVLTSLGAQFKFNNLGSTTAETFHYEIWIGAKDNATNMEGAYKVHESTITGALAGNEKTIQDVLVSVTPAISEPGIYYLWLILDSANEIVERNENNNQMRSANPIRVTNEPVLDADISIQTVDFTPTTTTPGGTFTAKIGLLNQGSQRTGSFICSLFLSEDMSLDISRDHIVGTINVSDLLANGSREVTGIAEADVGIKPGEYWLYAFCDSSGIVSEGNEDNNIFRSEEQLIVAQTANIDLLFGPIALESGSAHNNGEPLQITAPLCNQGSTAAGPFKVSVSRTNLCDGEVKEFTRFDMDGIEANHCETLHVNEPLYCDFWCPSYQLSFTADATDLILERNKRNNTSQLAETINLAGDDCVCSADRFETNNSTATARTVKSVDDDLTLCRGDIDVFFPDITDGQSFLAFVDHDASLSPLKLELLRGAEVVQTYFGGDHLYIQEINVYNTNEAPIYLRVSGLHDSDANRYHLKLESFERVEGVDLAVDNLIIESGALSASEAKEVTLDIHNLGSQNAESFTIGYYISQTSEIDESAWRISRQTIAGLNGNTTTSQSISLILPTDMAGGAYHLIARVDDGSEIDDVRPQNNTIRSPEWIFARSCWDVLDPNESLETAHEITFSDNAFSHDNLTVCQTNPDFYAFDVQSGSSVDISVTNKGTGDYDLFLYDSDGNEIASARTTAVTETIHKDIIMGDQRLVLEVRLLDNIYNARETNYALSVKTGKAPSWLNCNDAFEPNDFLSRAYDLRSAAQSGKEAAICPSGDVDYYQIELTEGDRLQIGFSADSAVLRAALYNFEYKFISMLTNLSKQSFDYTATEAGTYYVRVFTNAQDASQLNYSILWLGVKGTDAAVSNLNILSDHLYAGQNVALSYEIHNQGTSDSTGYVEIVLTTPTSTQVLKRSDYTIQTGESQTVHDKVTIPQNINGNAEFLVRITDADDVEPNNNEISVSVEIAQSCLNDANEPDDNILISKMLSSSISGMICQNDEDWFRITPSQAVSVALEYIFTNGDLVLSLFDDAGNHLKSSDTATGTESIDVPEAGTYYLRVRGATSSDTNSYTISIQSE